MTRQQMRHLDGQRIPVTALLVGYGRNRRTKERTLLFRHVCHRGQPLCQHQWIVDCPEFNGVEPGMILKFTAEVRPYVRHYQGKELDPARAEDYGLFEPRMVKVEGQAKHWRNKRKEKVHDG